MVCSLLIGGVCGFMGAAFIGNAVNDGLPFWQKILLYAILFAGLGAAAFLQTVLHEAGHLLAGLLTGYQVGQKISRNL